MPPNKKLKHKNKKLKQMSATKNRNGIVEKIKGRKVDFLTYVSKYTKKNGPRIHQADIDEVIKSLQGMKGLVPPPVEVNPSVPVETTETQSVVSAS